MPNLPALRLGSESGPQFTPAFCVALLRRCALFRDRFEFSEPLLALIPRNFRCGHSLCQEVYGEYQ